MRRGGNIYGRSFLIIFIFGTLLFPLFTILILPSTTVGELVNEDFADLDYTDPKCDQYTHYQEFEEDSSEEIESYGVKGKYSNTFDLKTSCIDIVSLKATLDSGTITITVEFASDIMYGMSLDYRVYFVDSSHQQPSDLLNPKDQKHWMGYWNKVDYEHSLIDLEFDYDDFDGTLYAYSSPELPSLTVAVDGNIITFTVTATDLEDIGITSGSNFGLYAYSHLIGTTFGDPWKGELTWDTAGVGAAKAPDEFNTDLYDEKSGDKSDDGEYLLLGAVICIGGVIAVVVIIVVVILYLKKKKGAPPQMQYYPPQSQQYPPQPPQKPS